MKPSQIVPIFMGSSCSRECSFCSPRPAEDKTYLEDESYYSIITQIQQIDRTIDPLILLCGGDALYKQYTQRLLEWLAHNNYNNVGIVTNGDLIRLRLPLLKQIRYPYFVVECMSLEAKYPGLHQYSTEIQSTLQTLQRIQKEFGIAAIARTRVRIILTCGIAKDLQEIIDLCVNMGIGIIEFQAPRMTNFIQREENEILAQNKMSLSNIKEILGRLQLDFTKMTVGLINLPLCILPLANYSQEDETTQFIKKQDSQYAEAFDFAPMLCCKECRLKETTHCCNIPKEYLLKETEDLYDVLGDQSLKA